MPGSTGTFMASIEHGSEARGVKDTQITFQCTVYGDKTALLRQSILDAARWYKHRQECAPEWFGVMYCIKMYMSVPQEIDSKGSMAPSTSFPFFEWKYDWYGTIEQYMAMRLPMRA